MAATACSCRRSRRQRSRLRSPESSAIVLWPPRSQRAEGRSSGTVSRSSGVPNATALSRTSEERLSRETAARAGSAHEAKRPGAASEPVCSYPIRIYDPRDEDAILALLRQTVGETFASRKTADFWRWKHADTPFGPSYAVCAWDDSAHEIAGFRTLMWWSFRDRSGAAQRAVRAVDTATHPSHQRRGIFSALTHYAIDDLEGQGVAFIFNTPNTNSLPGYLKMGWRTVARWPLYVRPVRWLRLARRLLANR